MPNCWPFHRHHFQRFFSFFLIRLNWFYNNQVRKTYKGKTFIVIINNHIILQNEKDNHLLSVSIETGKPRFLFKQDSALIHSSSFTFDCFLFNAVLIIDWLDLSLSFIPHINLFYGEHQQQLCMLAQCSSTNELKKSNCFIDFFSSSIVYRNSLI